MKYLLAGLNHRSAPVELRERVAIPAEDVPAALAALCALPGVDEAAVISTCNRVELLVAYREAAPDLQLFLAGRFRISLPELGEHLYVYRDAEAARHLFRVAASLDSMVVGEPQILGQVKEAYAAAKTKGTLGRELDRLMQAAFAAAKRVRSETGVAGSSVSIASVAVDLALKIFGSLEGKKVLLVGAGKMGELAARHLLGRGAGSITVANRTLARAERLAQGFGGRVLPFDRLRGEADAADIVITSTGSHEFVFTKEDGQQFTQRRRGRPMFFIDIAVPRDVDPAMNRVDNVFVYDIDDLQRVAEANMADRGREAARAERIVEAELEKFAQRGAQVDAVPSLVALQGSMEAMRQGELRKAANGRLSGLSPAQMDAVDALTRSLANKWMHAPMRAFREAAREGDGTRLETLRGAFQLEAAPLLVEKPEEVPAPAVRRA